MLAFVTNQPLEGPYISTVTLAEIRFGIEMLDEPNKRAELTDLLTTKVRPMFENRVLPISEDILLKWRLRLGATKLSCNNWSALRRMPRHGEGFEKIDRMAIKGDNVPHQNTAEVDLIAFRFYRKAPMVGYRSKDCV